MYSFNTLKIASNFTKILVYKKNTRNLKSKPIFQMFVTNTGMKLHCQLKNLKTFKIIISTCSTLGNFHQMNFDSGHFTHVLIDEAGQCTEPECLIPISMVKKDSGQIILVGDPMQLGPNVHCKIAMSRGLEDSFLVRLLDRTPYRKSSKTGFNDLLITKLLCSYRSIASILKPYNDLFYNSELIPAITKRGSQDMGYFLRVRDLFNFGCQQNFHGTFFFNVMGTNQQDMDSPSWYNPTEAKCINMIVQKMINHNIPLSSIGIITPYHKQVKEIENTFGRQNAPKIGTVEEFQGHEYEIVLISTVRSICLNSNSNNLSRSLGFVRCPRRMNVAISRARAFLMVFGDADLLSMNKEWEKFINYCSSNDAYINMNQSFDFVTFLTT